MCNLNELINEWIARLWLEDLVVFRAVRLRQEEKRQLEESSKVKERKRKREKYAERVSASSAVVNNNKIDKKYMCV